MATTSKVRKVQLMHAGNGQYYWHAKAANGSIILDGGEKLTNKKRLIEFIQGEWPHAVIEVLDGPSGKVISAIPALQTS